MKNSHSCLIILAFFTASLFGFVSCNSDTDLTKQEENKNISSRMGDVVPGNNSNPYDEAGWVYTELFETYYANGDLGGTVSQIATKVQTIADANSSFNVMKDSTYHPVSVEQVQYILDHRSTCVNDIISASTMTAHAQSSLTTFVNSLVVLFDNESNSEVLYQFVVDYEDTILNDSLLTVNDRQIILTTTSIARHSSYLARRKPKKNTDPDWIIFVGNVIAATSGAEYGPAEAVTMALVTGIAQN